jgi:hypothetical protein
MPLRGAVGGHGKGGAEFAGGEGFECAEAGGKLGAGETTFAIEAAEKLGGGLILFFGVAIQATGDQVAVRIAAGSDVGHNVVKAAHSGSDATQAIKLGGQVGHFKRDVRHLPDKIGNRPDPLRSASIPRRILFSGD